MVGTRIIEADVEWLDSLVARSGLTRGEVLRRLIALGREHEKEVFDRAS